MKILIAGFEGNDNSAKILLDYIEKEGNKDILYLENDFDISSKQIEERLLQKYDYVLIFGQKPNTKNIYLENNAIIDNIKLATDYNYGVLKENLENANYKVVSSNDAGNYLCNNVFFRALNFKQKNKLNSKIAFIHIPTIDDIEDINKLSNSILNYIKTLSDAFDIQYHLIDILLNAKPEIKQIPKLNVKTIQYLKEIKRLYYDEKESNKIEKYKRLLSFAGENSVTKICRDIRQCITNLNREPYYAEYDKSEQELEKDICYINSIIGMNKE